MTAAQARGRSATFALLDEVRARGGAARSTILQRPGHSPHRISEAVAQRLLVRIRRMWVALPDVDGELVSAARHGVVLS